MQTNNEARLSGVSRQALTPSVLQRMQRAVRRARKQERDEEPCKLCGQAMFVAPGQHAIWHNGCRTIGRRIEKK